ncbi:GNAT family N-acetyltransferase [Herbidospora galbida]|uniref:GNAT family N-acetyltransferase n=1 Tax=Herbidospora galbida TaxID=2575442 RepID=A0A4U3LUZ6_9ACTN|nr:GNAT family protein [Herbidospora galbida]TKK79064.1 GNAT family N-acetyltransferase [Herbidospora galbida]
MLFPHTRSRRVTLSPASSLDGAAFFRALLESGLESFRFAANASEGFKRLDAMFLVRRNTTGDVLGFSTLHGLSTAGHIRNGVYLDPARSKLGIGSEAVQLTINYAFAAFPIEQMIVQTTEASFARFGLGDDETQKEGVLPEHLYFRGRLWDLHSYRIHRHDWESYVDWSPDRLSPLDAVLPAPLTWRDVPN